MSELHLAPDKTDAFVASLETVLTVPVVISDWIKPCCAEHASIYEIEAIDSFADNEGGARVLFRIRRGNEEPLLVSREKPSPLSPDVDPMSAEAARYELATGLYLMLIPLSCSHFVEMLPWSLNSACCFDCPNLAKPAPIYHPSEFELM